MNRPRADLRRRWKALLVAGLLFVVTGCGASEEEEVVFVFAASSLTDAFSELVETYQRDHPDISLELNLGGSTSLREQILDGADADVFAAASFEVLHELEADGLVYESPQMFARNSLAIAVPSGNPGSIRSLADFERSELELGMCAQIVPCGEAAAAAFEIANLVPVPDTHEPSVRALLSKVADGELDGGVVYESDLVGGLASVERIPIDESVNTVRAYPIVMILGSSESEPSVNTIGFVSYVLSAEGQAVLARHGFLPVS